MEISKLNVYNGIHFEDSIVNKQIHSYSPRSKNYGKNDEIRIEILHQDLFTLPSESYIYIEGTIKHNTTDDTTVAKQTEGTAYEITNNAFVFLFEEIRYELNGKIVDSIKQAGLTTLLKGCVSYSKIPDDDLELAGWCPDTKKQRLNFFDYKSNKSSFFVCIPLKHLLGFAEDYKKIIMYARQELILVRSRNDENSYKSDTIKDLEFTIDRIEWRIPHIKLKQEANLKLLNGMKNDSPILMAFRKWELYELPALKQTTKEIWSVKTSTSLERPRYIIIGLHENRKDKALTDIGKFDHCNIRNVKIFLNSEGYPYHDLNLKFSDNNYGVLYKMYANFQSSYYGKRSEPIFDYNQFKEHALFVFDVNHQNEALKSSIVDLKIEIEAEESFKEHTNAYCLILSDTIYEYRPISSQTRKIV